MTEKLSFQSGKNTITFEGFDAEGDFYIHQISENKEATHYLAAEDLAGLILFLKRKLDEELTA